MIRGNVCAENHHCPYKHYLVCHTVIYDVPNFLTFFFFFSQGGDDEYEYSGDDFEDPYTPEELAQYAANSTATPAVAEATEQASVEAHSHDNGAEKVLETVFQFEA